MSKHLHYAWYLARHKFFVFCAGLRTGAPLWRLIIHDWTKFLPVEWFAYTENFFGEKTSETRRAFDRAWLHHQHRNPHHWQHWVLRKDSGGLVPLQIPDHFVREMVADWAGAGRAITGTWEVDSWYRANADQMLLHADTRLRVEELLKSWTQGRTAA